MSPAAQCRATAIGKLGHVSVAPNKNGRIYPAHVLQKAANAMNIPEESLSVVLDLDKLSTFPERQQELLVELFHLFLKEGNGYHNAYLNLTAHGLLTTGDVIQRRRKLNALTDTDTDEA